LIADLVSFNRKILEEVLYRLRRRDTTQSAENNETPDGIV